MIGVFKCEIKFLSEKWEKRIYHPAISHACRLSIYNESLGWFSQRAPQDLKCYKNSPEEKFS